MSIFYKKISAFFLVTFFILLSSYSYSMSNLQRIDFKERKFIEKTIDELNSTAKDPYAASLPLIMSAGLGDKKRYALSSQTMLFTLASLDEKPLHFPEWMRSQSFKAWMWGRLLLAADSVGDKKLINQSEQQLSSLLSNKNKDSLAFFTWAQAYHAAFNKMSYDKYKIAMLKNAVILTNNAKKHPENHGALSDALWAWVMNLSAAAMMNDQDSYIMIKKQILALTNAKSVTESLEMGLVRTADSNDYPAWALGKVRLAAAKMHDHALYHEMNEIVQSSIAGAKEAGAKAEYGLAVIENQLAREAHQLMMANRVKR
jgi:hypothetical protein